MTPAAKPAKWLVLLSRLPMPMLHGLAPVLALLARVAFRSKLRTARNNLSLAFPNLEPRERRDLSSRFLLNLADVVVESVKSYSITPGDLDARVQMRNPEMLDRFATANRTVLIVGSHEANWEWVFLACSKNLAFEVHAGYKPVKSPSVNAFLHASRSRFGASLFTREQFLQQIMASQGRRRAIGLVVDERPGADEVSHRVSFLGRDTSFRSAFEQLARLLNAPVIFSSRRRIARGHYTVVFELLAEPPFDPRPGYIVERYVEALERSIRSNPADWLWHVDRWRA